VTLFLLLLALAQPDADECQDRRPGLSKCVLYWPKTVDAGKATEWGCKAVCYKPKKRGSEGYDGGTDASILYATGADQPTCKTALERKCAP